MDGIMDLRQHYVIDPKEETLLQRHQASSKSKEIREGCQQDRAAIC
jgi:hypothetical protein